MKVAKYSGEQVEFERDKLRKSLFKSGANEIVVNQILQSIENELYEGMPTKRIYKLAFQQLKGASKVHAARYNLRSAIVGLGPAGFHFEKFVSKILQSEGNSVILNQTLQGRCVSHEVDLVFENDNEVTMVECKFHTGQDAKTDVKVPMYILSRFNDLKVKIFEFPWEVNEIQHCLIVTNNRFTEDALSFAQCSKIQVLSWDQPSGKSLRDKIDSFQLYPITSLTTLTMAEKNKLLEMDCIIVKDLLENYSFLNKIDISELRIKNVLKEAGQLCHPVNY
jgi:hypothetical protein